MRDPEYPKPIEDYIREGLGHVVLEKEFGFKMYEYQDIRKRKTLLKLVTNWSAEITVENNEVQLTNIDGNAVMFIDTGKGKVILEGMPFDEDKWYKLGEFRGKIADVNIKTVENEDKSEMKIEILIECKGGSSCMKLGGSNGH